MTDAQHKAAGDMKIPMPQVHRASLGFHYDENLDSWRVAETIIPNGTLWVTEEEFKKFSALL